MVMLSAPSPPPSPPPPLFPRSVVNTGIAPVSASCGKVLHPPQNTSPKLMYLLKCCISSLRRQHLVGLFNSVSPPSSSTSARGHNASTVRRWYELSAKSLLLKSRCKHLCSLSIVANLALGDPRECVLQYFTPSMLRTDLWLRLRHPFAEQLTPPFGGHTLLRSLQVSQTGSPTAMDHHAMLDRHLQKKQCSPRHVPSVCHCFHLQSAHNLSPDLSKASSRPHDKQTGYGIPEQVCPSLPLLPQCEEWLPACCPPVLATVSSTK